jgi:hypothetical protein
MNEKIGYPDNLDNDTLTTLAKEYAGVRNKKYYPFFIVIVSNLV